MIISDISEMGVLQVNPGCHHKYPYQKEVEEDFATEEEETM